MAGLQPSLRGKVYYAVGSVGGQRIRKSLGTRDKQRAEELCAHLEAALWRRHTFGEEAVRTFEEAALSYMEAGGERKYLPPIIRRFKGHLLASIKPGEIREAARVLYPEAKGSTRNRHVIVPARAVINHGASLGWCQPIRVANFPTEKTRRTAVGRDWIDSFLRQADVDKLPHLAAAVLFTWQTGARASEVSRVLPEHVNLHERTILLERTKTEWRVCHISRELMLRLANLPTRDGRPLFGYSSRHGIARRMKAVCRRAGIPFVSPHQSGRHSFATNALAMGATVKQVMEAGGWKSARLVLETYAHAEGAGRAIADRFDTDRAQTTSAVEKP
jgi:integrase